MSRQVARNPFARCDLHASRVHDPDSTCQWCGGKRMTVTSGRNWLYQFWVETDQGGKHTDEHLFCSRECRTIYSYPHEKSDGF
jgi:hypothetical protein